jgi:hypothetical protein
MIRRFEDGLGSLSEFALILGRGEGGWWQHHRDEKPHSSWCRLLAILPKALRNDLLGGFRSNPQKMDGWVLWVFQSILIPSLFIKCFTVSYMHSLLVFFFLLHLWRRGRPVMRYISSQMAERFGTKIRIVAAASSLANARDLGEWIGATHAKGPLYMNLMLICEAEEGCVDRGPCPHLHLQLPSISPARAPRDPHPGLCPGRPPMYLKPQQRRGRRGSDNSGFQSRMFAMYKPTFLAIRNHSVDKPVIIFVPEKKYTYDVAVELIGHLVRALPPLMGCVRVRASLYF